MIEAHFFVILEERFPRVCIDYCMCKLDYLGGLPSIDTHTYKIEINPRMSSPLFATLTSGVLPNLNSETTVQGSSLRRNRFTVWSQNS